MKILVHVRGLHSHQPRDTTGFSAAVVLCWEAYSSAEAFSENVYVMFS